MKLLHIEKSNRANKKYMANVEIDGKIYNNVHFGSYGYTQYHDSTPLKLYSYLDNNDPNKRRLFYLRHARNMGPAAILSKRFLWS